ncbi:hypothetical protein KSP39_PZI007084 [Platanthera zijinensis]|uniref:Uncharacterized protein n=1 Tax=Platanthera zijinensis TaxID=2320716 RepID=A0AAP0G9E0_9ASPA
MKTRRLRLAALAPLFHLFRPQIELPMVNCFLAANYFPASELGRSYRLKAGSNAESRVGIGIADAKGVEETDKLEES